MITSIYQPIGAIRFNGTEIEVYNDLDYPLFLLKDVARIMNYRLDHAARLAELCEEDEKCPIAVVSGGQRRTVLAVTETGLYDILEQMRTEPARAWRRIVNEELIELRRSRGRNIAEQFEEWDHKLDDIWFDEETGMLMESVTIPGGDVEIRPYKG